MERVIDLATVLQREVADYVRTSPNSTMHYLENQTNQTYSVISVPNYGSRKPVVVILARVADNKVIVEADATSNPLYEELLRAGIPDEQIVLAYEGENVTRSRHT